MSKPHSVVRILATVLVVIVGSAVVGRAASIGSSSHTIGAGAAAVATCATPSFTVTEPPGATISQVTIANIAAACAGATLSATVDNNTATTVSQTVPTGGGSLTLTLGTSVALVAAGQVDVVLTGP